MFIKSGMVKIFKEGRNGKYIILKVAVPRDFLGLLSIYGGDTHHYSASAIQSSEICFVDINVFNKLLTTNGDFSRKIVQQIANDGLFIFDRLMSQSHKQLPGRIADVILYFSEVIYKSEQFEFPFTRRELAELAGTTKESFIRTLAEFKHDNRITSYNVCYTKLLRSKEAIISTDNSKVKVMVVPTDEELVIAEDTLKIVSAM